MQQTISTYQDFYSMSNNTNMNTNMDTNNNENNNNNINNNTNAYYCRIRKKKKLKQTMKMKHNKISLLLLNEEVHTISKIKF
jgi:hypothetical protein